MIKNFKAAMPTELICFSHLRWNFVYQRPQHLMNRFAYKFKTYFIEEPIFAEGDDRYEFYFSDNNVCVITPFLNRESGEEGITQRLNGMLKKIISENSISNYIFWYYTPMALAYSKDFEPALIIYDCMDELSAFKFAPPALRDLEAELFRKADLVFTGGVSLYEHKKHFHHNIFPIPSSIDKFHFETARVVSHEPADQENIPKPRLGYYGVIDERFDIDLVSEVAKQKPEWQFILLGPVVKIDPATLPHQKNIHYPGGKKYDELPAYIAGWDIAMIPFARNESTRFISPTKTPEYLAAGKPVISTSITDVIDPYGLTGLVLIADTAEEFIKAAEKIFAEKDRATWLETVDEFLAGNSWDKTWTTMLQLIDMTLDEKFNSVTKNFETYV